MKGIKDFLIMYFLCVIVLLIAATVLSGVKGGLVSSAFRRFSGHAAVLCCISPALPDR